MSCNGNWDALSSVNIVINGLVVVSEGHPLQTHKNNMPSRFSHLVQDSQEADRIVT